MTANQPSIQTITDVELIVLHLHRMADFNELKRLKAPEYILQLQSESVAFAEAEMNRRKLIFDA